MKGALLLLMVFACGCKILPGRQCYSVDATGWSGEQTPLKAGTSIIEYDGNGIHDTTAIDLVVQVLDLDSGHPVAGVAAQISGHETFTGSTTNTLGSVGFIAFFNGGGNFDLEIIHPEYACLRIKNLLFGSGQIVRLNIKLKKRG